MISVVIPALNEERAIVAVLEKVHGTFKSSGIDAYEIVVVDDGSSDATGQRAASQGARVVRNLHNLGYGRSLKRGIEAARFDTIVITDADGTYPVEEIPSLLEEFAKGYDLVIGSRNNLRDHDGVTKRLMRRSLRGLVEVIAGRTVPDINSGLRVFHKQIVTSYFPLLCDTFSFTTSQTLTYMLDGRFVSFYPLHYSVREGKSKVRLLRDSARTLQFVVQTVLYSQPIRIFILASTLLVIAAVLSLVVSLATHLFVFYMLGIGAALVALLVFCLGLLADLLKQILRYQTVGAQQHAGSKPDAHQIHPKTHSGRSTHEQ
jgi:glycosyltransferase involved in cell wall biosynthesis